VIESAWWLKWFPPKEIGLAEGILRGWKNFGSAFRPYMVDRGGLAFRFAGGAQIGDVVLNWRGAIAITGLIAAAYGIFYFFQCFSDTPPGRVYQKPLKRLGLE